MTSVGTGESSLHPSLQGQSKPEEEAQTPCEESVSHLRRYWSHTEADSQKEAQDAKAKMGAK